jgi:hypothetical protein
MAMKGDIHGFIDYVSKNAFSKFSNNDLKKFDEKYIKVLLLAYLFQSKMYIPISEYETDDGYTDIFLQRNPRFTEIKFEWILELKYLKATEGNKLPRATRKASEQLKKYINTRQLSEHAELKAVSAVFIGKNKYEISELKISG